MDANGTRFHLLFGEDDWGRCSQPDSPVTLAERWRGGPRTAGLPEPDLALAPVGAELTLRPSPYRFPAGPAAARPSLEDRRGAGRDRHGTWYRIDDRKAGIVARSAGTDRVTPFWPAPAAAPPTPPGAFVPERPAVGAALRLAGLAVTDDHLLLVGVQAPEPGLLVFDLAGGGAPSRLRWPAAVPFSPFDLAARPGGGAFVLDADHRRLWELDRTLAVVPGGEQEQAAPAGGFEPAGDAERPTPSGRAPRGADAVVLPGRPIAVEAAPDGSALVLDLGEDRPSSLLHRVRRGRVVGGPASLAGPDGRVAVRGHDLAVAGGDLLVVSETGDQAYAFALALAPARLELRLLPAYLPMRRFGGRALVGTPDGARYDCGERWVPLVPLERTSYPESAMLVTPPLDSRIPGCAWHRVLLDACVPPGCALRVWTRAADEPDGARQAPWRPEPAPRLRAEGPERPWLSPAAAGPHPTWELLLQRARGRYLQLRLELAGDGRATPRVRAMRIWYPRFSYLREYLPPVYREDAASASFLDRFLANLEGIHTLLEDRIAGAHALLDVRTAPAEALDWLAGWVGIALDPGWDEARRRLLLGNALAVYARRGTPGGIELALRLAFEPRIDEACLLAPASSSGIRIFERFRARRLPALLAGDPTAGGVPRQVVAGMRWTPTDGGEELHRRWRAALRRRPLARPGGFGISILPELRRLLDASFAVPPLVRYPLREETPRWRAFSEDQLGFLPSVPGAEEALWRRFLARRRRVPEAAVGELQPRELPPDGPALNEWYAFETIVLPRSRAAHRFTVLLPVPEDVGWSQDWRTALALARRIVELEKPAHTVFDVKLYRSAFRIGEARLARETLLGRGSDDPALVPVAVVGEAHVGESRLDTRQEDP